jgi:hypothetical protein
VTRSYYTLLLRAIAALDSDTKEDRSAVYNHARNVIAAAGLSSAELEHERSELEAAIERIEAERGQPSGLRRRLSLGPAEVAQGESASPPRFPRAWLVIGVLVAALFVTGVVVYAPWTRKVTPSGDPAKQTGAAIARVDPVKPARSNDFERSYIFNQTGVLPHDPPCRDGAYRQGAAVSLCRRVKRISHSLHRRSGARMHECRRPPSRLGQGGMAGWSSTTGFRSAAIGRSVRCPFAGAQRYRSSHPRHECDNESGRGRLLSPSQRRHHPSLRPSCCWDTGRDQLRCVLKKKPSIWNSTEPTPRRRRSCGWSCLWQFSSSDGA